MFYDDLAMNSGQMYSVPLAMHSVSLPALDPIGMQHSMAMNATMSAPAYDFAQHQGMTSSANQVVVSENDLYRLNDAQRQSYLQSLIHSSSRSMDESSPPPLSATLLNSLSDALSSSVHHTTSAAPPPLSPAVGSSTVSDFIDDDLPLPRFKDVFAFASQAVSLTALAKKGRAASGSGGRASGECGRKRGREEDRGDETSGRWTAEEHRLFLEGVMLYGKDWKKMQPLIKTRSLVQIRTHAQKVFKKIGLRKMDAQSLQRQLGEKQREHIDRQNLLSGFAPTAGAAASGSAASSPTSSSAASATATAVATAATGAVGDARATTCSPQPMLDEDMLRMLSGFLGELPAPYHDDDNEAGDGYAHPLAQEDAQFIHKLFNNAADDEEESDSARRGVAEAHRAAQAATEGAEQEDEIEDDDMEFLLQLHDSLAADDDTDL